MLRESTEEGRGGGRRVPHVVSLNSVQDLVAGRPRCGLNVGARKGGPIGECGVDFESGMKLCVELYALRKHDAWGDSCCVAPSVFDDDINRF